MISLRDLWDKFSKHTHTLVSLGAAAANHNHPLASLGAAAADHTHPGMLQSYARLVSARGLSLNVNNSLGTLAIPPAGVARPARVSLPVIQVDENSQGTEPGYICHVRINGTDHIANTTWIVNDRYGNGLNAAWTPIVTFQIPADVDAIVVEVRVQNVNGLKNLRCDTGYVWLDVLPG